MSRSGYSDDLGEDQWALICYRGAVKSAIRGKRGQVFLLELRDALDALPEPKLCEHDLQRKDGSCCALGAVGKARGIDMTDMDPEFSTENEELSKMFDIANSMVREIEWENDDDWTPFWHAEQLYEKREEQGRLGTYTRKVPTDKRKNDAGEFVDANGLTQEKWQDRQDRGRWSRMRQWVVEQLKNPLSTGDKSNG